MAQPPSAAELAQIPQMPLDEDGAVFNAPWEAKVFAMVVSLHQQGHFEWHEWAATISDEIENDKNRATETPYYQLWLRAAERIFDAKGLCAADELQRARAAILAEQHDDHAH